MRKRHEMTLFAVALLCVLMNPCLALQGGCRYKQFEHAIVDPSSNQSPFIVDGVDANFTVAVSGCNISTSCKAIATGIDGSPLYYTTSDENGLLYVDDDKCEVWLKLCDEDLDYRHLSAPDIPGYFEPTIRGVPAMDAVTVRLKMAEHNGGLVATGTTQNHTYSNMEVSINMKEIPLPRNLTMEEKIDSWCTNEKCEISPRTYYQTITTNFSLVAFSDGNGLGHVLFLDHLNEIFDVVTTRVEGRSALVGGIFGFHDQSFAVSLFVDSPDTLERKMYLRLYRPDRSIRWTTLLNSAISVPDRNVGDFRLSYGNGYFMVYFSVYGTDNFANATNGEQISFVDDRGNLKTTSFPIPGQEHVKTGDAWGCSHALAQLADHHSLDEQFITVCSSDLFPKGISLGDSLSGTLLYKASGNGRGFSSAQLGQLAEANSGWKLLFNAQNSECCPGSGIGFITIYNEKDQVTSKQQFDPVMWITSTNGTTERDPAIARVYLGDLASSRETYLLGWKDVSSDEYFLEAVNTFGIPISGNIRLSEVSFGTNNSMICSGNCVRWGNRDDSFRTLKSGDVGWVFAPTLSRSMWIYSVKFDGKLENGWSLWSGWAQCSQSCDGGITTRVRTCMTEPCPGSTEELKECNTAECKVPITCTYERNDGQRLDGDLFVNGARQFAFTQISAEEKCSQFIGLCKGITRRISGGYFFYFLKTSTDLIEDDKSITWFMSCRETPGWSPWTTWEGCSVTCGGGTQSRTRFCDGASPGSAVCEGSVRETQSCNVGRCPAWSEWTQWTVCSTSCNQGTRQRNRVCTGDYPDACYTLTGPSTDTQECSLGACGTWMEWSTWSECTTTCGDGFQERIRDCIGDFTCEIGESGLDHVDSRPCNLGVCPYWSVWNPWSACAASCGEATRTRNRDCLGDYDRSRDCPILGDNSETDACNLGECPYWGAWGSWGNCLPSCGAGTRQRSRPCLGDFPLQFCPPGEPFETEECSLGECARLDEWLSWGECSSSCGDGTRTRSRNCLGDFPCPEDEPLQSNIACNLGTCPGWSIWGLWGPCDRTCGDQGSRVRTRQCLGDFPQLCRESGFSEMGECVGQRTACPRWEEWTTWGGCSETCGNGTTTRRRTCRADSLDACNRGTLETDALGDSSRNIQEGMTAEGFFNQMESSSCSNGRCSYWLNWGSWGPCSSSCNEGVRNRRRECFGDFPQMCVVDGPFTESEGCIVGQCGSWGGWSSWGQCSETCGSGIWSRNRICLGDFTDACIGPGDETEACDVSDCVHECDPNPCNNGGECRRNVHLARLYHCVCAPGWIGKHCDYLGPELICGSSNMIISFDRRMVAEEGLLTSDPSMVGLVSRDSVECTAMLDHYEGSSWYLIMTPMPIDTSCGSVMQISPSEYRIRNRVTWEVADKAIKSTVILFDFTCVYRKNATVSSDVSSQGAIAIESYKREIEMATSSGIFEVDIALFRDITYQQSLLPIESSPANLVTLAEGDVVFVSVDLRSKELLPSGTAVLVMDVCFVTTSRSTQEPLLYLLQESCPVSRLVTVLSNGESRSGRFSVRVFGWSGTEGRAQNVFIHCTVNVCDSTNTSCVPNCNGGRQKRDVISTMTYFNRSNEEEIRSYTRSQVIAGSGNEQTQSLNRNGRPYTNIVQVVPPESNGNARVNLTARFDDDKMVSAGPFDVILVHGGRRKRSLYETQIVQIANFPKSFLVFLILLFILALTCLQEMGKTSVKKPFQRNVT